MNYEEKLKKHFEMAQMWYNDITTTDREKARLEAMFPELKERRIIEAILDVVTKYGPASNFKLYRKMIAWLEEQAGQKGDKGNEKEIPNSEQKLHEWSEIEDIAVHLENLGNTAMANTLRSFRPQANHEWSEEDEKKMNELINILEEISQDKKWDFRVISDNNKTKYVNWIKLIESRYRWKPSTAQMGALADACNGKILSLDYLNSLYMDLKKLMDE